MKDQPKLPFEEPTSKYLQMDRARIERQFTHSFSKLKFPTLMVLHEKHEPRYFLCFDFTDIKKTCFGLLRERFDLGYWYYDDESDKVFDFSDAKAILEAQDQLLAWKFLDNKQGGEYENFEFCRLSSYEESEC